MITKAQIKKLHTLKSLLSISDDIYREILSGFNVDSCKSLSSAQAKTLIDDFQRTAVELGLYKSKPQKFEELSERSDMATPAQLRMIEGLWKEVSYKNDEKFVKQSLRKFIYQVFSISDMRFLDRKTASKAINAIKNVRKNSGAGVKNSF